MPSQVPIPPFPEPARQGETETKADQEAALSSVRRPATNAKALTYHGGDARALFNSILRTEGRRAIRRYVEKLASEVSHETSLLQGIARPRAEPEGAKATTPGVRDLVARARVLEERTAALQVIRAELAAFETENEATIRRFEVEAVNRTLTLLQISDTRVALERRRYGIDTSTTYVPKGRVFSTYRMEATPDSARLAEAALRAFQIVQDKDGALRRLRKARDAFTRLTVEGFGPGRRVVRDVTDLANYTEVSRQITRVEKNATAHLAPLLRMHPVLSSFIDRPNADALRAIGEGPSEQAAEYLHEAIQRREHAIQDLRARVIREPKVVWELPLLVEITRRDLEIPKGAREAVVIDEYAEEVDTDRALVEGLLGVLSIAVGLVAAIPSAGSSVSVSAAAAGALFSGVQFYRSLDRYLLEDSAARSDFAIAESLSKSDPHVAWLVLDLAGLGADVFGAARALRAGRAVSAGRVALPTPERKTLAAASPPKTALSAGRTVPSGPRPRSAALGRTPGTRGLPISDLKTRKRPRRLGRPVRLEKALVQELADARPEAANHHFGKLAAKAVTVLRDKIDRGELRTIEGILDHLTHARRAIAQDSPRPPRATREFGRPRTEVVETPLSGPYRHYARAAQARLDEGRPIHERVEEGIRLNTILKVEDELVIRHKPLDHASSRFNLMNLALDRVLRARTKEDLIEEVAELHWWVANVMPYKRGSAAALDILTKALLTRGGVKPGAWRKYVGVDLEAMVLDREEFVAAYPTFFQN